MTEIGRVDSCKSKASRVIPTKLPTNTIFVMRLEGVMVERVASSHSHDQEDTRMRSRVSWGNKERSTGGLLD